VEVVVLELLKGLLLWEIHKRENLLKTQSNLIL